MTESKKPFKMVCDYGGCHGKTTQWTFDEDLGEHTCSKCGISSTTDIEFHKMHLADRGGY